TEGYREKREETLARLARKIANQVKATGRPRTLEPMNPYERRVLHATLQNNPYVATRSEGEEPNRRVVIFPKGSEDTRNEE
ncbi:MAG: protein jag, partial [Clostridiales bacterium]|nr:protein jag [Clostridiales bacterium]